LISIIVMTREVVAPLDSIHSGGGVGDVGAQILGEQGAHGLEVTPAVGLEEVSRQALELV
jgi:hypothetical protein